MIQTPDQIEQALDKAAHVHGELTADERKAIREVLEWWRSWKALGKVGKLVLWIIISAGAIAAAIREVKGAGWFGG